MVSKGWHLTCLGDLGRWSGGGTPSKAVGKYWEGGTIPWVSPKDMGVSRISYTEDYITQSAVKNSSTKVYPEGSVLVVTRSGILRRRVPVALAMVPVSVNQDIKVLSSSKEFSSEYIANFMWCFNEIILARCAKEGTTVESIDTTSLLAFPIKLPPLSEQKKIAQILSTWDQAINITEQLLTNSQQQKKALMQQLLTGKKRLLDENGVRFSEPWLPTQLSNMGRVVSGGTPDTKINEFWDGDIHWLTPTDVTALSSRFVSSTNRTISELGVRNSSATLLPAGSLMVCTRATIGALAISTTAICTNQGFKNIIPTKKFDVNFIYYILANNLKELIRKASGSTFLELSKKDFEQIKLDCPAIDEQQKIAAVLSTADDEITALQQKLTALKQEKKALMQQLLTGKRRVIVDDVSDN